MKINTPKFIISIVLAILFGFLFEIIAPETDSRNWISLGVGALTVFSLLFPAMGVNYLDSKRGVSIKVFAWIMTIVVVVANIIFASFEYKIDVYVVITLILAVAGWGVIYALLSSKPS